MLAALGSGNQLPERGERGEVERLQTMERGEHEDKLQAAAKEKREPEGAQGKGTRGETARPRRWVRQRVFVAVRSLAMSSFEGQRKGLW